MRDYTAIIARMKQISASLDIKILWVKEPGEAARLRTEKEEREAQ